MTRFATLLPVAAFAAVVAAAPGALEVRHDGGSCNSGPIQCCNSVQTSDPTTVGQLGGLLGLDLPNISGLIGLGCTPITAIGLGNGATCTAQTVCCTNNNFNGVVNLGCSPVNLSL